MGHGNTEIITEKFKHYEVISVLKEVAELKLAWENVNSNEGN